MNMNKTKLVIKFFSFACLWAACIVRAANDYQVSYTIGAPGNTSEVSIKGDMGTGSVQPGGSYNYSFPIEVPPGPRGIAPQLSIVYTGEGNGWVGRNWYLGFGAVTRDASEGIPTSFAGNVGNFLLNGSKLIKVTNTSPYRYKTEIDSHQYITYESGNKWVAKDPDGTISEYSAAIPTYQFNGDYAAGDYAGTREWRLKKIIDTKGNTVTYNYNSGSAAYPASIVWGAPSSYKSIIFHTVARTDKRVSFASGSWVIEDQIVDNIYVYFNTDVDGNNGTLIRKYQLGYEFGALSGAKRLVSIKEYGTNTSIFRETTFTYDVDESANLSSKSLNMLNIKNSDNALYTHFIMGFCADGSNNHCFANGSARYPGGGDARNNLDVADIDNDGIPEIIQGAGGPYGENTDANDPLNLPRTDSIVWTMNGNYTGFDQHDYAPTSLKVPIPFRRGDLNDDHKDHGVRFVDYDRDGDQDIIYSAGQDIGHEGVWVNGEPKGVTWTQQSFSFPFVGGHKLRISYNWNQDGGLRIADVNGDGYPDLLFAYDTSQSHVTEFEPARYDPTCYDDTKTPRPPQGKGVYLMKRNPTNGSLFWELSTIQLPSAVYFIGPVPADDFRCPDEQYLDGSGGSNIRHGKSVDADLGTQVIDINGDGLPDIVKATNYSYTIGQQTFTYPNSTDINVNGNAVWINNGHGWEKGTSWTSSLQGFGVYLHNKSLICKSNCQTEWMFLDFNDDGLPDLQRTIYVNGNPAQYQHYRNTGTGWEAITGYPGLPFGGGQLFQDFSGDGRPDYLQFKRTVDLGTAQAIQPPYVGTSYMTGGTPVFFASNNTHPDLLKKVKNWLGGEVRIEYDHSSSWRHDHNGQLPQTRYVVTAIESDPDPGSINDPNTLSARDPFDGNDISGIPDVSRTKYEYRWGKFDFQHREFRGFGWVTSETNDSSQDPGSKLHTETYYNQDDALKGLIDEEYLETAGGASTKKYKLYTYDFTSTNGLNGSPIYDRNLVEEIEKQTATNPTVLKRIKYGYDSYGNLLSKIESGLFGTTSIAGNASKTRKTVFSYIPNTSQWLVNYPSSQTTYWMDDANDTTPTLVQEAQYLYDGQATPAAPTSGLLTQTIQSVNYNNVDETDIITKSTYDSYGNKITSTDANGNKTVFQYISGTYLSKITNVLGHTIDFYYHGVNATPTTPCDVVAIPGAMQKFVSSNSPTSATTCYSYDALGRLLAVYDPLDLSNPQVSYNYNYLGLALGTQRIEVTNRAAPSRTIINILDGFGRIVQTREPATASTQLVTTRQFDLNDRLWRSSAPVEIATSSFYTKPVAGQTRWSSTNYDELSRIKLERNIDGTTRSYTYSGLDVTGVNERGVKKDLRYDALGRLYQVKEYDLANALYATTDYVYDVLDDLLDVKDQGGNINKYFYDSIGRKRKIDHVDRGIWNYSYDGNGNVIEQIDAKSSRLRFDYDELGRLVQKHNPTDGLLAQFFYDNKIPVLGQGDLQELTAWNNWGGNTFPMPSWYDTNILHNMTTDTANSSIVSCSNCGNYAAWVTHQIKSTTPTKDLLLTLTFRDAPVLDFFVEFRDSNDNLMATDSRGNLATGTNLTVTKTIRVPRQGYSAITKIIVKVHYGQLELYHSSVSLVDDASVSYTNAPESAGRTFTANYGIGKLTGFADATGQTTTSYDIRGRVAAIRKVINDNLGNGLGYVTDNTYTFDDLIKTVTYPNGEVLTYNYDTGRRFNLLTSNRVVSGVSTNIIGGVAYNTNNQLSHVDYSGYGSSHLYYSDYTYRTTDLRLDTLISKKANNIDLLQSLDYNYDLVGNITSVRDNTTVSNAGTTQGKAKILEPVYDHLDRLTSVKVAGPAGDMSLSYGFSAAGLGNFTTFEGKSYSYGNTCGTGAKPHQVCRIQLDATTRQQFTYDGNGSMLTADNYAFTNNAWSKQSDGPKFTYDRENRVSLVEIPDPNGSPNDCASFGVDPCDKIEAFYDAQGARVKRILTKSGIETTTLYVGPHYEKRLGTNQDGSTSLYHAFGRLIGERIHAVTGESGVEQVRYFFADHLGSSSVVWNSANQALWAQTYRPYGMDLWGSEPNDDAYKFTGQQQDYKWLYDFKARSYLPGIGTFAQADKNEGHIELPITLNPYMFVTGNPLKYTDPSGNERYNFRIGASNQYQFGPNNGGDMAAFGGSAWNATGGNLINLAMNASNIPEGLSIMAAEPGMAASLFGKGIVDSVNNAINIAANGSPEQVAGLIGSVTANVFMALAPYAKSVAVESTMVNGAGKAASGNPFNPSGSITNCAQCAIAVDNWLKTGKITAAAESAGMDLAELANYFGKSGFIGETIENIKKYFTQQGNGATGIVAGLNDAQGGKHVFNVMNQNGVIKFMDGQFNVSGLLDEIIGSKKWRNYRYIDTSIRKPPSP